VKWSAAFCCTWLLAAQTAPPQGSIEGLVVNASTGAPLRKVSLHLFPDTGESIDQDTDPQGGFQFTALPPGSYRLQAQRAGFVPLVYGARSALVAGTPIVLSPDQHVTDLRLRLIPQGVITGRVLDEDGDPVADTPIWLFKMAYRGGRKQWTLWPGGGVTSDTGEFRAANLEAGQYLVGVLPRAPGPRPSPNLPRKPEMISAATYYPNALTEQSAAPIDISPGSEVRGIDIHVMRVPSYRIRGTVSGTSAAKGTTRITLYSRENNFQPMNGATLQPPDNQFELRGVPPGDYVLFAQSGGGPAELFASQPVAVTSGHLIGFTLALSPGIDIPGQVSVAEPEVPVNLKNIQVALESQPLFLAAIRAAPRTDAEGRFTFKNFPPARYTVNVENLPDGCFVQKVKIGGQEVGRDGVEISSAAPFEVVLSSTAAAIAGLVTDKDGQPLALATVVLLPSDSGRAISATADRSGNFTVGRLRPGTYKLLAWEDVEPGAWDDPEIRKRYDSQAAEIQLGPRERRTTQLHAIQAEGNLR